MVSVVPEGRVTQQGAREECAVRAYVASERMRRAGTGKALLQKTDFDFNPTRGGRPGTYVCCNRSKSWRVGQPCGKGVTAGVWEGAENRKAGRPLEKPHELAAAVGGSPGSVREDWE